MNPFEIRCDLYTENTNKSIYESIARAVLTTGNNRVLTFHSNVNSDSDTSVSNFVNESTFKDVFKEVVNSEFPEKKGFYKKISMFGLHAPTVMAERRKIIKRFKKCEEDNTNHEIAILSSCETIGEGVDTNDANMRVFVDPKSSIVKIIQNIGRIVRKQFSVDKANSTILIPCWVDKDKFAVCNGVKDECDKVIREDMSAGGNFSGILNVMSALQQEQPDVYDLCMNYPDTYTYQEIESNFVKQGYKIDDVVGEGTLQETIEYIIDKEIEGESIDDISKNENVCIEVYTELIDESLIKYNENCDGDVVHIYKGEDDTYQPIIKNDGNKKCCKTDKLNAIDKKRRINVNFNSNSDIKVLWNIDNRDSGLSSGIKSCLLKCEVVDVWNTNFEKLKEFIDTNKRTPSQGSINKDEKFLSKWLTNQNRVYKNRTQGMKRDERYNEWSVFLEQYNEYINVWNTNFDKLKKFIDTNKKMPITTSKNKNEINLGKWLDNQNQHYKSRIQGMKNDERYDEWCKFIEQYNEYIDVWNTNIGKLKRFIDINNKTPSTTSKNNDEKILGSWLNTQNQHYKKKVHGMKNDERYDEWTTFKNEYLNKIVENKPIKSMKLVKPTQPKTAETPENKRIRTESQMEILHKRYKTLTSSNLNREFKENIQLWNDDHEISEKN